VEIPSSVKKNNDILKNSTSSVSTKKTIEASSTKSPFTLKEIVINYPNKLETENITENKNDFDIDKIIKQIIFNHQAKNITAIQDCIDKQIPQALNLLKNVKKVLAVSENGIVVIFEKKIDADLLNASFYEKKFVEAIADFFGKNYYVLGCDKIQAKKYIQFRKDNLTLNFNEPELKQLINYTDDMIDNAINDFCKKL
jgi:hypothetical protein